MIVSHRHIQNTQRAYDERLRDSLTGHRETEEEVWKVAGKFMFL